MRPAEAAKLTALMVPQLGPGPRAGYRVQEGEPAALTADAAVSASTRTLSAAHALSRPRRAGEAREGASGRFTRRGRTAAACR